MCRLVPGFFRDPARHTATAVNERRAGFDVSPIGTRLRFLGGVPYSGFGPFSRPFRDGNLIGDGQGAGTGEPPEALREEETIHLFRSPLWERVRGCFGGPVGVRNRPETPRLAAVNRSCQGFTRIGDDAGLEIGLRCRHHLSRRGSGTAVCGASRPLRRWLC
jgi:hypothetical protein